MIRFPWFSLTKAAPPVASAPLCPDREQARDIVSLFQKKPEKNQIMAENVAGYVAHLRTLGVGLPAEGLEDRHALHSAINSAMCKAGQNHTTETQLQMVGKLRWLSKLQRDVEAPYTDSQVGARLDHCCAKLTELLPHFSSIPHQLYLVGGPLAGGEGRFGANSDLDLVLTVADQDRARANLIAEQLNTHSKHKDTLQIHITSDSEKPAVLGHFAHYREIDEAQAHNQISTAVREGIESRGLKVDGDWRSRRVDSPAFPPPSALKRFPSQLMTSVKR